MIRMKAELFVILYSSEMVTYMRYRMTQTQFADSFTSSFVSVRSNVESSLQIGHAQ